MFNKSKAIFIALSVVICISLLVCLVYYINLHRISSYNSKEKVLTMEQIVNKVIKVQYRGSNEEELKQIFTPNFIASINSTPNFYKKRIFYKVDKNFMSTLQTINQNDYKLSVRVEDLSGSYIQVITLTKDTNGNYLIHKIEYDI